MRVNFRDRVRRTIERKGSFSTSINGSRATIETWGSKGFRIKIADEGEEKPRVWIYRLERVAFDRFEEYCGELRR